jgi:hypothetical protein
VGVLARLRPGIAPADLTAAAALSDPYVLPVALGSPWAPVSALEPVIVDDIFGSLPARPVTRAEAMRVPAVARARHIICRHDRPHRARRLPRGYERLDTAHRAIVDGNATDDPLSAVSSDVVDGG